MRLFRNAVKAEDREALGPFLDGYDYKCSGLSFTSLYMWRDINEISWQVIGEYLCIEVRSFLGVDEDREVRFMMPPLTASGEYDRKALRRTLHEAGELFREAGFPFVIRLVPEHMRPLLQEACPELEFEEDRPNFDYIYETDKLIEFRGRKLHSKKNHLNWFRQHYEWECVDITPDMQGDIMEFIRGFNRHKDIPEEEMKLLLMEEQAMEDVFRNVDQLGYIGCAVLIDGRIEGLALGGWRGDDMIVEHIEKANKEFRGLYQLVLSQFCRRAGKQAKYINREEDMGLENLRMMKMSYRPDILLKKYIGTISAQKDA